jgi:PST family polysaccharide transporter
MELKEKIKNGIKSKDGKVLAENFVSLSLLKLIGYIFPLITLPYLARVIGIDSFGEIAFASSIVIYFETIIDFGFSYTATRDVAKSRNDINEISRIFSIVFFSKLLLLGISFLIFLLLIFFIPFLFQRRILLLLTFLYIPGYLLFQEWFFLAMEKMKYITIMNVLSKLLFTVLVFIVIKKKSDYIYQPLLTAIGFFISGIISLWIILKNFKIKIIIPSWIELINSIKDNWNMFLSTFIPNLYTNFSVILLRIYGNDVATGIYSSGKRFIDICDQLTQILSRTFFPFLARRIDKHDFYVKLTGTLSIIMGVVLFLGADLIVKIFYTQEFSEAATVIRIMAISPFFLFLMNTYGTNYLVLIGKENVLKNIVLWCSIAGFILAWLIVIKYGYIGISLTLVIVWGIRGIITWFFANKYKKSRKEISYQKKDTNDLYV